MTSEATVFDVQRFSIHDGPGIRTVVFFKGCSLRCRWCQNPESINAKPELAVYGDRCLGAASCRQCEELCTRRALRVTDVVVVDRSLCDACGECVDACPAEALRMVGTRWTAEALLAECLRDRAYADASSGGVTLSGGEPVLHAEFLRELLPLLRAAGVHVLLETAGNYAWDRLASLLPLVDEVYFDWKVPAGDYRAHTGHDATRIAENLRRLAGEGTPTTVRMPVIPGINTTPSQIADIARTLTACQIQDLTLLRYHGLWQAKLPRLDTKQTPLGALPAVDEQLVASTFATHGVRASA